MTSNALLLQPNTSAPTGTASHSTILSAYFFWVGVAFVGEAFAAVGVLFAVGLAVGVVWGFGAVPFPELLVCCIC